MGHKILFITFWYPTFENPVNGIFIREHARAVRKQGHELVILHFDIAAGPSWFILNRGFHTDPDLLTTVYRIRIRSRFWKWFYHAVPLLNLMSLAAYGKIADSGFQPDVIHSNVIFPCGVTGAYLSRKKKIPSVLSEHWSGFADFCRHPVFSRITRKALGRYAYVLPVSRFLQEMISTFTPRDTKLDIIPNILDSGSFTVKHPRPDPSVLTFFIVANWQRRKKAVKRPDLIFRALEILAGMTTKKILLRIAGEGELLDEIKARRESVIFDLEFLGYISKQQINLILHETDFFLHASEIETFSVVTAEALLTGTPVIVSDLPALRELVNPDTGILVRNDAEAWAEAIQTAISREWDHQKIAASVSGRFTHEAIGQKISEVYRKVCNENN